MGRLIPAGTGMEFYRNVTVDRDETADQGAHIDRGLDNLPDLIGADIAPAPAAAAAAAQPAPVAVVGDADVAGDDEE
jgi:hypothetical protein